MGAFLICAIVAASGVVAAQPRPPLKIGIIFSYSGTEGATPWGGRSLDAVIAAFQRRYGDTIAGRKVQIITRDDTGIAPETARRLAQELIVQDDVDALAGITVTPNAIAVADASTKAKKPFFLFSAATRGIIANAPYATRWGHTNSQITAPLARWAVSNQVKSAYALFQDYGPGIDAGKTFESVFTAGGGKMLGEVRIPLGTKEFSAYVQRAKDAHPEAIFVFLNPASNPQEFVRECANAGFAAAGIKILATGEIVDENVLASMGDAALGVISSYEYSETHDSRMNHDFVRAFDAADGGHERPDFGDVAAWDALTAIYRAAKQQNGALDPDQTLAIVKGMRFESPRGEIAIDPNTREVTQTIYIRRVEKRNGVFDNIEIAAFPNVDAAGDL
jgi:branched-chain amino acid transport system substrate-binding protein